MGRLQGFPLQLGFAEEEEDNGLLEPPPTGCAAPLLCSHQASGERCLLELSGDNNRGQRLPVLPHRWAQAGLPSKQSVGAPRPARIRKLRAGIVFPAPEGVDTKQD